MPDLLDHKSEVVAVLGIFHFMNTASYILSRFHNANLSFFTPFLACWAMNTNLFDVCFSVSPFLHHLFHLDATRCLDSNTLSFCFLTCSLSSEFGHPYSSQFYFICCYIYIFFFKFYGWISILLSISWLTHFLCRSIVKRCSLKR